MGGARGRGESWGRGRSFPQVSADQLTLFKPKGHILPTTLLLAHQKFQTFLRSCEWKSIVSRRLWSLSYWALLYYRSYVKMSRAKTICFWKKFFLPGGILCPPHYYFPHGFSDPPTALIVYFIHSMLRLDATTKKRYDGKLLKFKKFRIKQAFFINEIFSSRIKVLKEKKIEVFFRCFSKVF